MIKIKELEGKPFITIDSGKIVAIDIECREDGEVYIEYIKSDECKIYMRSNVFKYSSEKWLNKQWR